ncbi:MAG: acyl-CoA dehydrogenase [Epsilonproteobacteria bacterium]|nr:acyl-CoA dehydrogenase [Campylobacterota bacterium]
MFYGIDFLNIDSDLSDEEKLVRDSAREFVQKEVLPEISTHFEEGTFPTELVKRMGELGFLGANIHGYGCSGLNNVAYGLINQELERGDTSLRSFASVQGSLVMPSIYTFGSEEQKERYLPELAAGKIIGCFGLTEADHGSDPGSMETKAVKKGDKYILNGAKMWISNGSIADIAIVWAKLDGVVRGFIVPKDTKGFSTNRTKHKMSLRASVTSELVFADAEIPEENILSKSNGLKSPLICLNQARYGIAWGVIGAAMACIDEVISYTKNRTQFGKPLAAFQLTQSKLADMITELSLAQLTALKIGRLKDAGKLKHYQLSLAKRNNAKKVLEIARQARGMMGANGILLDYQTIRHMLNLETVNTYEGTYEIHSLIIGKQITGIDALRIN